MLRSMVRLILALTAIVVLLMAFRVIPLLAGFGLIVVALLAAVGIGDRVDRGRQRGRHAAAEHFDEHRGQLFGHSSEASWDTPQAYIDHPDGGGVPPGVETQSRVGGLPAGSIVGPDRSERR